MKKIIVVTSLLFMSACSSTSTDVAKTAETNEKTSKVTKASSDGIVCRYEKLIGSNRKKKICTTAQEREVMREAAQEALFRRQGGQQTAGGDGF